MSNVCIVKNRMPVKNESSDVENNSPKRKLQGNIDAIDFDQISGWVMDTDCDEGGVPIELFVRNQRVGTGTADIRT